MGCRAHEWIAKRRVATWCCSCDLVLDLVFLTEELRPGVAWRQVPSSAWCKASTEWAGTQQEQNDGGTACNKASKREPGSKEKTQPCPGSIRWPGQRPPRRQHTARSVGSVGQHPPLSAHTASTVGSRCQHLPLSIPASSPAHCTVRARAVTSPLHGQHLPGIKRLEV